MNRSTLLEVCKERKMYLNPELNEVCYFHFQGFHKIENLEEFDNCVSLWL